MRLLKPNWVHHGDHPIFSIDVHPDNSRFATGGQGADSGKIVIWNMGPIIDLNQENDPNIPRILCQMDHHISCVNVVRWSNNGLFLASGSDDKLIMIWNYVSGGSYQNIENWKCGYTLRAHNGDILDLAWSSKDQYLASCSVDNTIIIWNAMKFPDILTRINAHNGFVKGVAWDPVGTFFASQSDDKTLKIWKTLDWNLEKSIEEPFKDCTGTTHVLRLNWSPDGQLIISAHAINNGAPTAQIIDRSNKWATKLDFVGHRKAVTAVILKEDETKCKKTYCLCALGSRDRSVSIWLTKACRPLCVLHDLFDNPIMDLSWCTKPKPALLACSMDGTVSYIQFENKEVGYPLSKQETDEFFISKYNYDVNAPISIRDSNVQQLGNKGNKENTNKDGGLKFIENYDILLAQEKKQSEMEKRDQLQQQQQNAMDSSDFENFKNLTNTPDKSQSSMSENQKQIERRMPDGRRRITPICISKPGEYDAPRPFGSCITSFDKHGFSSSIGFEASNQLMSKTATEQSTIIVEKRDEKDEIVEISPVKSIVYSKPPVIFNNSSNSNDVSKLQQLTSTQAQPQIQAQSNENAKSNIETKSDSNKASKLNETPKQPATTSHQAKQPQPSQTNKPTSITTKPPEALLKQQTATTGSLNNLNKASKTVAKPNQNLATTSTLQNDKTASVNTNKQQQQQQQQKPQTIPNKSAVVSASNNLATTSATQLASSNVENDLSSSNKTQVIQHSNAYHHLQQCYLAPLRIDSKSTSRIFKNDGKQLTLVIENSLTILEKPTTSFNSTNENDFKLNLLKVYENETTLKWQIYLLSRICDASCNNYFVSCVCDDSTLNLIKLNNGMQICCPIVLDSQVAVLHSTANYCMCVTVNGYLYLWKYDLEENKPKNNFNFSNLNDTNKKTDENSKETNFFNLTAVISQLSCNFLLNEGSLNRAFLTDSGVPVIQMTGNKSYFYSMDTKSWHLTPINGILSGSRVQMYIKSNTLFDSQIETCPLNEIQSRHKSSNLLKAIEMMNKSTINATESFNRHDFTINHLESQMNAAIGLDSPKEYKFWLLTYARYLVENDYQDKLSELCNFLLGPLYSISWNENIMIYKKRDLLKEILPIIAGNLNLQRIYSFYKKQFNLLDSINQKSSVLDRLNKSSKQPVFYQQNTIPITLSSSNELILSNSNADKQVASASVPVSEIITQSVKSVENVQNNDPEPIEIDQAKPSDKPASVEIEMEKIEKHDKENDRSEELAAKEIKQEKIDQVNGHEDINIQNENQIGATKMTH